MLDQLKKHPLLLVIITFFLRVFHVESKPTQIHLCVFALAIYALNTCKSVRFMFLHFIHLVVKFKLKSFYYTFSESKVDIEAWSKSLVNIALNLLPIDKTLPILFIIDDTLIEKFGEFFEAVATLHDHAAHNGTNYLFGHCLVCLAMLIPVKCNGEVKYIRFPVAFKMWIPENNNNKENTESKANKKNKKKRQSKYKQKGETKKANCETQNSQYKTKLRIAFDLLELAYSQVDPSQQVVLLADSWYPKGEVLDFIKKHDNVEAVLSVKKNTVFYDCVIERTGKPGRPRTKGVKLNNDQDFQLTDVVDSDYRVGFRTVTTNLFGHDKEVMAMVTESRESNSRRYFVCTNPQACSLPVELITDEKVKAIAKTVPAVQWFATYALRWAIETTFLEQKAYWGLCDYMLRSVHGIETLVNLQSIAYAALALIPWLDPKFACLQDQSIQERRYEVGRLVDRQVFLANFGRKLETDENSKELAEAIKEHRLKEGFDFKIAS